MIKNETADFEKMIGSLLELYECFYNKGFKAGEVFVENLNNAFPYYDILKLGTSMILEGKKIPNVIFKSEIIYSLNQTKEKQDIMKILFLESFIYSIQNGDFNSLYETILWTTSNEFKEKHSLILNQMCRSLK